MHHKRFFNLFLNMSEINKSCIRIEFTHAWPLDAKGELKILILDSYLL